MMTAAPLTDEALVPRLVAGDDAAVAELLGRYWERAYRVALSLTGGDPAGAEDVAQEAFVEVLRSVERFDTSRRFRPWFYQVLANTHRRRARGERRRRTREERAARAELHRTVDAPAEQEQAALVREHLNRVRPEFRHALALRYLEGLSLKEVAAALEIPEGTVSSRIRRGLKALRESLAPALQLSLTGLVDLLESELQPHAPAAPEPGALRARLRPSSAPTPRRSRAGLRASPALAALVTAALLGVGALGLLTPETLATRTGALPATRAPVGGQVATLSGPSGEDPGGGQARAQAPEASDAPPLLPPAGPGRHWLRGRVLSPGGAWVRVFGAAELAALPRDQITAQVLGRQGLERGDALDPTTWIAPAGSQAAPNGWFAREVPDGLYLVCAGAAGCTADLRLVRFPEEEERPAGPLVLELVELRPLQGLELELADRYGEPFGRVQQRVVIECEALRLLTRDVDLSLLDEEPGLDDWFMALNAAQRTTGPARHETRLRHVRADARGRLLIAGTFPPGRYTARSDGPIPAAGGTEFLSTRGHADLHEAPARITLELERDEPHANVRMTVVDSSGRPQVGAQLLLLSADELPLLGQTTECPPVFDLAPSAPAFSDEEGRYLLHQVQPGSYFALAAYEGSWGRVRVQVGEVGITTEVRIPLDRSRPVPSRMAQVVFEVRDGKGQPLPATAGARLQLLLQDEREHERWYEATARDAGFALQVEPGSYQVLETVGPGARWARTGTAFTVREGAAQQRVVVRDRAEPACRLHLEGPRSSGQAQLTLEREPRRGVGGALYLVADVDGVFQLQALAPGRYQARVSLPGYVPRTFVVEHPGDTTLDLGVGRRTLVFRSPDGQPLEGVQVSVLLDPLVGITSDAQGRAVIRGPVAEPTTLEARLEGYEDLEIALEPGDSDRERTFTLRPRVEGWLRGKVLDEARRPLAGARVKYGRRRPVPLADRPWDVWEQSRTWEAVADDQGRFSLAVPVGEGVLYAAAGPRAGERAVVAGDFEEEGLVLSADRGGKLSGRVRGELGPLDVLEGVSPRGRQVRLGGTTLGSREGWDGRFESSPLAAGAWTLRLLRYPLPRVQGSQPAPEERGRWEVRVEAGQDQRGLELRLND